MLNLADKRVMQICKAIEAARHLVSRKLLPLERICTDFAETPIRGAIRCADTFCDLRKGLRPIEKRYDLCKRAIAQVCRQSYQRNRLWNFTSTRQGLPLPRQHRVFLSARDRADVPSGSIDFVIGESIAHIVVVSARLFDRQLALRLRRHNVPIGQWPFLLFLWANEDLSQRDLSRLMAIEESTVTNTIDRMERDGLISRIRIPANRRRNQLRLTERGRELMSALLPEAIQVVKTATHGMSEMEIGFLTSLLGKVQVNLADERARPLGIEPRAEPREATDAAPDTYSGERSEIAKRAARLTRHGDFRR